MGVVRRAGKIGLIVRQQPQGVEPLGDVYRQMCHFGAVAAEHDAQSFQAWFFGYTHIANTAAIPNGACFPQQVISSLVIPLGSV